MAAGPEFWELLESGKKDCQLVGYAEPPHVHVRREKMVAKFWLDPVVLERAGGFNRVELNMIAGLVQEHRRRFAGELA